MRMIEGQLGGKGEELQSRTKPTTRTCDHFMNLPSGVSQGTHIQLFVLAAEH